MIQDSSSLEYKLLLLEENIKLEGEYLLAIWDCAVIFLPVYLLAIRVEAACLESLLP